MGEAKLDNTPSREGQSGHVGDVFSKMSLDEIEGKAKDGTPPPPPNPQ